MAWGEPLKSPWIWYWRRYENWMTLLRDCPTFLICWKPVWMRRGPEKQIEHAYADLSVSSREKDIVRLLSLSLQRDVFSPFVATGRPRRIKLTWQTEYSHLQWRYSSRWHFPTELTALMVSSRLRGPFFLFCPVHCVEKTPRRVTHCLSNIFNPIYCGHVSHSIACLSSVAPTHTHT